MSTARIADPYRDLAVIDSRAPRFNQVVIGLVALLVVGARSLRHLGNWVARRVASSQPDSRSQVIGVVAAALIAVVGAGVLILAGFLVIDRTFASRDREVDPSVAQPASEVVSGSGRSVIPWDQLGADGRRFVSGVPTRKSLEDFSGKPSKDPIRVYAGVATSESAVERRRSLSVLKNPSRWRMCSVRFSRSRRP